MASPFVWHLFKIRVDELLKVSFCVLCWESVYTGRSAPLEQNKLPLPLRKCSAFDEWSKVVGISKTLWQYVCVCLTEQQHVKSCSLSSKVFVLYDVELLWSRVCNIQNTHLTQMRSCMCQCVNWSFTNCFKLQIQCVGIHISMLLKSTCNTSFCAGRTFANWVFLAWRNGHAPQLREELTHRWCYPPPPSEGGSSWSSMLLSGG